MSKPAHHKSTVNRIVHRLPACDMCPHRQYNYKEQCDVCTLQTCDKIKPVRRPSKPVRTPSIPTKPVFLPRYPAEQTQEYDEAVAEFQNNWVKHFRGLGMTKIQAQKESEKYTYKIRT